MMSNRARKHRPRLPMPDTPRLQSSAFDPEDRDSGVPLRERSRPSMGSLDVTIVPLDGRVQGAAPAMAVAAENAGRFGNPPDAIRLAMARQ